MTYENVLQWLVDNVPINQSTSYQDWLDVCKQEINTPELFESESFNSMHEQKFYQISKRPKEREQEDLTLDNLGEGQLPDKLEVTRRPDIQTGSVETRITYREPLTFREQVGQALPDRQVVDVRPQVDSPVIEDVKENQAERIVTPVEPRKQNRIRAFVRRLFGR